MKNQCVMMRLLFILVLATLTFQANAGAIFEPNPIDTREYLVEFHKNPKKVMNAPLSKRDETGRVLDLQDSPFGASLLNSALARQYRDQTRQRICEAGGRDCEARPALKNGRLSEANRDNLISSFLYESQYLSKLLEMENQGLLQGMPKEAPWSDSFWPQRMGLAGRRWLDSGFPNSGSDFMSNYSYWLAVPPSAISTSIMSPSEKYDFLVGDRSYTLTQKQWSAGASSMKTWGQVPGWAGLCHGWAPAAIAVANPMRSVSVRARNGQMITFHPSDIKALASVAWGEAPPIIKFVGNRCKVSNPREDEVGRVVDEGCFDVNPGTWHMAVTNQIGVNKRSFVFDSTYDLQVWNYPIAAYHYRYFNPQTLAVSNSLAGAAVRVEDFSIDKFKKHRSPQAKYVVGIAMDVTYSEPVQPRTAAIRTPLKKTVKYVYDVELDSIGTIIGGEWYSNWHPDFIWNLPPDGRALSVGEKQLTIPVSWDGLSPLPDELHRAALVSSSKGQVLAVVVEALVQMAKESQAEESNSDPRSSR